MMYICLLVTVYVCVSIGSSRNTDFIFFWWHRWLISWRSLRSRAVYLLKLLTILGFTGATFARTLACDHVNTETVWLYIWLWLSPCVSLSPFFTFQDSSYMRSKCTWIIIYVCRKYIPFQEQGTCPCIVSFVYFSKFKLIKGNSYRDCRSKAWIFVPDMLDTFILLQAISSWI